MFALTQIAHTFRPRRKGKRSESPHKHRYHALQALAIRDKRVYVLGTPQVPSGPVQIYLDMEGNPDEGFVYLIGMIVCDGDGEQRYSFWADSKDQECDIFEQFLALVSRCNSPRVFCYGGYERAFIKRMRRNARRKRPVDTLLGSLTNTLSILYAHFYFPTYSNGLKEVGACLGSSWSDEDASGIQSIAWRMRWDSTRDDRWKAKLIEYNLEDCAALKRVTDFLQNACGKANTPAPALPQNAVGPPIAKVQDLDQLAQDRKWGKTNFVHADFEFVNNRAYFDYQRQRVFIRTGTARRKRALRLGLGGNRTVRPSRRIEITDSKCPACGDTNIVYVPKDERRKHTGTRAKRGLDLVITPRSIRRRVIECRAAAYRCEKCGHWFAAERHKRLAKHFHGLMSWVMYQHVAHRLSYGTLRELLREFFGLGVTCSEIQEIKSLMARYYRVTYRRLLAKILSGSVLHADETVVKLKAGKGYVWLFTSEEEVVCMYRPTREGEFLRETLKNFTGVLVSDFYAAYDSLNCPQQKCLIHLIRDMNQELLNNPYDEELRSLTEPFGVLLRSIVETVDKHGLKRRHLLQHERQVADFFEKLSARSYSSDAARTLQERLVKYQGKLFTFIQYDGVSWNNNNAENGIKQFAYYREGTVGVMKEAGLNDYLVLLSIYQTCRYKGVSFLKFLLSKQRDIDAFRRKERSPRRLGEIEVYPKDFTPHIATVRRTHAAKQQRDSPAT